jgi:hypothetical protein
VEELFIFLFFVGEQPPGRGHSPEHKFLRPLPEPRAGLRHPGEPVFMRQKCFFWLIISEIFFYLVI